MPRLLSLLAFGFVTLLALLASTCILVEAGAFALIADLDNGTIYKGTLERSLADLTPLPLSGVMRPAAVDYDPVDSMVYWTDLRSDGIGPKICRAHLDGRNQTIVVRDLHSPTGMALDVTSRMLYWTDASLAQIGRARMDGTGNSEIIFMDNHYSPQGIVVDNVNGHIFWSDIGPNARIERADLDGSNRTIVVPGLDWPTSVTIDSAGNSLYWIDALGEVIETSDISGNNRRIVANLSLHSTTFAFDLAVYGDYVYWTERLGPSAVYRVHLDGTNETTFGPSVFQLAGGIHIQEGDTSPPVVSGCPTGAVTSTVPLGTSSTIVTWTPPTATDDSGGPVTGSSNYSPGDIFNVGTTDVRYSFADAASNQAFCDFVVVVTATDSINPMISCPPNITRYVRSGSQQVTVSWSSPTATDDSGVPPTVTSTPYYPTPSGSFAVGLHTITYTAQDAAQNEASCTVTIDIVVDSQAPAVTGCPSDDITDVLPRGNSSVAVRWTEPVGSDANGVVSTTQTHRPGDVFTEGHTQVTYTFTDQAGNQAYCTFNVTVLRGDVTDPVISCPPNTARYVRSSSQQVTVSWSSPTATDDSGVPPTVTSTPYYPTPSGSFAVGLHTITYTARDAAQNEASCTVTIDIVVDSQAPAVTGCPSDDIADVLPRGNSSVAVRWTEPVGSDANEVVSTTQTHRPGDVFTEGHTQVTYTFTDQAGNQAYCTFNVTVSRGDLTDPVISCPPNTTRYVRSSSQQVTVSWSSPTVTDDSGVPPTVTSTPDYPTSSGLFQAGLYNITYTARDEAGNEAACTFTVNIIVDSQAPTITGCPDDIPAVLPPGNSSVAVPWTEPVSSDENGYTNSTQNHRPGDLFTQGDTDVTYTFNDRVGNQAICTFTITVVAGCVVSPDQLGLLGVVSGLKAVYLPGETVQFECPAGYQLSGSANRICRLDFTWSGDPAVCEPKDKVCTAPPTPNNVTVAEGPDHIFRPGERATFTCSGDLVVTGTDSHFAQRVCQSDGSWSGKPVECSADHGANGTLGKAAGGAVAGGVFIVILLIVFFLLRRWRKNSNQRTVPARDIALIPPDHTYDYTIHTYEGMLPREYETHIGGAAAAAAGAECAPEKEVSLCPPPPPPLPDDPPPSYENVRKEQASDRPPTYIEVT